jgi:hypothetical protein
MTATMPTTTESPIIGNLPPGYAMVTGAEAGHGKVAIDAGLGFDDDVCPGILVPFDLTGWHTMSAHAPSRIGLICYRQFEVFGFLNGSARNHPENPVTFSINGELIGTLSGPGERTPAVRLPQSHHTQLQCSVPANNDSRHAVWAIREVETTTGDDIATVDNTRIITIAAYPAPVARQRIAPFVASCHRQRTIPQVFGIGETYDHYKSKVERMRKWIGPPLSQRCEENLNERIKYILYIDGRDSLLVRPLAEICREFNAIGAKIACGMESSCWPVRDSKWAGRFRDAPGGRRWTNAGVWMGERNALVNAMDSMIELHRELAMDQPSGRAERVWQYRNVYRDDQFLWQASTLDGSITPYHDSSCRLVANFSSLDHRLIGNSDFDFMFHDGDSSVRGVILRSTGARPGVLHFSGPAAGHCMDQWAAFLSSRSSPK